jgi:hypothetical protein
MEDLSCRSLAVVGRQDSWWRADCDTWRRDGKRGHEGIRKGTVPFVIREPGTRRRSVFFLKVSV